MHGCHWKWSGRIGISLALAGVLVTAVAGQVPHPREVFGFEPGAERKLADYAQLLDYFGQLDRATERMRLVEIGRSTQGRPMVIALISSEANLRRLEDWRSISARLASGRTTSADARALARAGRAIVWIDNGLHSTEVAPSQHAPLLAHHLVTDESEETRRIRDEVVLLLVPLMNPDGHEIVVNWYRSQLGTPYETTSPPVLYHQYVGHDNNRDWLGQFQQETKVLGRAIYHEWYPQVLLNHHQTGPFPARVHIAPFADPLNPAIPALVVRNMSLFGTYMARRFEQEGKSGVLSRRTYDMWRVDGTRYAPYYHNMIGLHTEVGHASATPRYHHPDSLPRAFPGGPGAGEFLSTLEPSVFYPNPWKGGWATLKMAVDYHFTASMAVLDLAARLREEWLFGMHQLAREAIAVGVAGGPYAYVIPPAQWDPGEAVRLVNILRRGAVEVHRAERSFSADGKHYEAGSYVVRADQPFRSWVLALFERQRYPERRRHADGPLDPPRDLAGWTLPDQMGVRVDRVEHSFAADLARVDTARVAAGTFVGSPGWGYILDRRHNAATVAINRLLAAGEEVSWADTAFEAAGQRFNAGALIIRQRGARTEKRLRDMVDALGVDVVAVPDKPNVKASALRPIRVGLYKSWRPNMDEGWTRWLLEQYEFQVDTLVDAQIRAGDLSRYQAIILPAQPVNQILNGHSPGSMPPAYVGGLGAGGVAALKRFVQRGGTLITLDQASDLAISEFGLPLRNDVHNLPEEDFFIPGSLVRLRVDSGHSIGAGMPEDAVAFFVESRAFSPIESVGTAVGINSLDVVARYASNELLVSGLATGESRIAGKAAVVSVGMERGTIVLFGFRPQFRAQPAGTFKLLFNALHGSNVRTPSRAGAT